MSMSFRHAGVGVAAAVALATAPPADAQPSEALTLDAAIARAVARSELVTAARARREAAGARVDRGYAALWPTLTLRGTATRRDGEVTQVEDGPDVAVHDTSLAAEATGAISLYDRRAHLGLRGLRLERDAARLDEADARRRLTFEVAAAYLAALGAEQVVAAADRRADYARERLADAKARATGGLASSSDATGAELELATAQRERAAAAAELQVAYEQLGFLVAGEVAGPLAPPADLLAAAATAPPIAGAVRPDLEAERLRVAAARAAARVPGAGAWPTLGLSSTLRVDNEPGWTGEDHEWTLGVVATWEVWDGGARAAEARELAATARAAAAEHDANQREAATETAVARARLEGARAALAEAERAADAAGRYADEVAILYRQGLTRALEVTDASARRFDAEVALVRARFAVGVAYLDELAAGGGTLRATR